MKTPSTTAVTVLKTQTTLQLRVFFYFSNVDRHLTINKKIRMNKHRTAHLIFSIHMLMIYHWTNENLFLVFCYLRIDNY